MKRMLPVLLLALALPSCKSGGVDMEEASRVLGRDNGVHVDAEFLLRTVGAGSTVPITYEVENQREASIAFADMIPMVSFDAESATYTVLIGSEVPGNKYLPRLIELKPGERRSFKAGARLPPPRAASGALAPIPRGMRLSVVFLSDVEPFRELVGIPEKAVDDAQMADRLFLKWVENTRTVTTNDAPLRWKKGEELVVPEGSRPRSTIR